MPANKKCTTLYAASTIKHKFSESINICLANAYHYLCDSVNHNSSEKTSEPQRAVVGNNTSSSDLLLPHLASNRRIACSLSAEVVKRSRSQAAGAKWWTVWCAVTHDTVRSCASLHAITIAEVSAQATQECLWLDNDWFIDGAAYLLRFRFRVKISSDVS